MHLQGLTGFQIRPVKLRVGKQLHPQEISQSGLYALLSVRTGRLLRVSMDREIAAMHCCDDSRSLAECWVLP